MSGQWIPPRSSAEGLALRGKPDRSADQPEKFFLTAYAISKQAAQKYIRAALSRSRMRWTSRSHGCGPMALKFTNCCPFPSNPAEPGDHKTVADEGREKSHPDLAPYSIPFGKPDIARRPIRLARGHSARTAIDQESDACGRGG